MSRSGQCVRGQQCVSSLSVNILIVVAPSIAGVHAGTPYMARSRRLISCQIALLRCTHNQVDGGKQCLSSRDAMMTSKLLTTLCRAPTCSGGRAMHVCEIALRQNPNFRGRKVTIAGSGVSPPYFIPLAGTRRLSTLLMESQLETSEWGF